MADERHVTDMLPGLALGAVAPEEERLLRRHLARCAVCREELASLEKVTGSLSLGLPRVEPPADLEQRIMDRVYRSAGPQPAQAPVRAAARFFARPALAAAAAVLIVALAAGNVMQWVRGASRPVAGSPGFTTWVLVGQSTAQGAFGTVVLDSQDESGVMAMRGLPRLDAAHQYQLWLVRDGARRSGGVFSVDEEGYGALLLKVPVDFKDFTSIGISLEPAGGSPAPTGARVATGKL